MIEEKSLGVFKTSLVMDSIRDYNAQYFGEENILVNNDLVYPFPLNKSSFDYKLINFKNENADYKLQKYFLMMSLLFGKKFSFKIPQEPSKIDKIFYLTKGESFSLKSIDRDKMIQNMIFNEISELNIPPTHNLSGIKQTGFSEILKEYDNLIENSLNLNIISKMKTIFSRLITKSSLYEITMPNKYSKKLLNKIINETN